MGSQRLSVSEIEELSYYDFMSYLGASFFQIGGPKATEQLLRLCDVDDKKHVLVVGSGSGFGACHIAKKFGCRVTGVDIAELSVENARKRAQKEGLSDLVEFRVGDAHDLPYDNKTFDIVATEFVSQFLDNKKAFAEFARVLKDGGRLGVDELYKDDETPAKALEEINAVEQLVTDITGLSFVIHTPKQWNTYLEDAGFTVTQLVKSHDYMGVSDTPHIIREIGGIKALARTLGLMIRLYLTSSLARKRFGVLNKVKSVLLRKKNTKKHVGYVLAVGEKGR